VKLLTFCRRITAQSVSNGLMIFTFTSFRTDSNTENIGQTIEMLSAMFVCCKIKLQWLYLFVHCCTVTSECRGRLLRVCSPCAHEAIQDGESKLSCSTIALHKI